MNSVTGDGWLNVIYRLPSKPSTLRVNVWKQVKELGGLALQQSTYAFPDRPEVRVGLAKIERQVADGGGETTLFEIPWLDDAQEASFVADLGKLRDEEYAEIAEDCEELAHRIERKTGREHFDREEVADAREDLARIAAHLGAIAVRDYFGSPRKAEAERLWAACDEQVRRFAERSGAAGAEEAAPSEAGRPVAKRVKESVRLGVGADEAIARARCAIDDFESGTLRIGGSAVDAVGDSVLLELKYSDRNGKRCLEIEMEW